MSTYAFMNKWGREDIRLSDGTYFNLRTPDYSTVRLWPIAEAVCYDYRYVGQGRRKMVVGEHLLKGITLARKVAVVSAARKYERDALEDAGLDIYFPDIEPDLAAQAWASHDLHEGIVHDATRAMKRMVPGIGELEEIHCWPLRQRLGLPGPEHPVWKLVKWVDTNICFNEIAQLWQEPVPEEELYYLVGDPDLPIRLDFLTPDVCWPLLCEALTNLGWDLGLC